ncbi:cytochrome P450 [Notoacmeibacter sp. MSK16QG-6]|uniref:cytochrome P450 n=1 Tax=Notoacmeibacter sp. MSK16QG-6 TaxID=2957982 RepID=UPI0020A22242|nr:cytochrome P450 [Notoacmeibacter sp. MSK16QG-6]MCP1198880.1 cytochrome P450 [Notoacmeibacter sp. MSK16QG-6]
MDAEPIPFVPPAPRPRTSPPSFLEMVRTVYRNPIALWGEPSYNQPYVHITQGVGSPMVVANDPVLIRHILVDNVKNYRMAKVRQLILRPILRDGLLTAEGVTWKRGRKAMAPVFTPRHIRGFAQPMKTVAERFVQKYAAPADSDAPVEIAHDMTQLTYEILAETLFSNEIAGVPEEFGDRVDRLLHTMGRVDPLDLLAAPEFIPRLTRIRGRKTLRYFRGLVRETMDMRRDKLERGEDAPEDFLTLLLRAMGPDGLSEEEVEDNIITFIGAGHETTARALAWTLYCLSQAPDERAKVENEVDRVVAEVADPYDWLDAMPVTRAAFEETMRLYPPAPSINRESIEADQWRDLKMAAGTTILVMPWTLHRHRLYWDQPDAFMPSRFLPQNRESLDRYQYLPFGAGPRVCIGATFAMQEAAIALGVLLSQYRFDLANGAPHPFPVQKLTVQPQDGIRMSVSRR